jgi:putative endonuclease
MGPARFIADLFSRFSSRCFRSAPETGENPNRRLGRRGEELAARYLRRHGHKVLYRNFRAKHGGEVDIVCRDKSCNTLVFIEVKTRRSTQFGAPAEAVTRDKQHLIARGALAWLGMLDHPDEVLYRFDIVEVLFEGEVPRINHIKDAFPLPEPFR